MLDGVAFKCSLLERFVMGFGVQFCFASLVLGSIEGFLRSGAAIGQTRRNAGERMWA